VNQSKKKKAAEGYSQGTIQSKNKKSAHTHSHGTGFSFEVGLSVTKSLGKENSKSESGESAGDDHSGHTNLKLDGDETHSHDGSDSGDGGGTTPPAFDPTLTARLSYKFVPSFGALLLAGYALESGSIDPEAGVAATVSMSKRLIGNATVTASYPASKASQENYKITTIKLTAGPTYNLGRYTFGFAANTAYSWYSKTIIYEDEEGGQSRQLRLLDDGHDHDTAPVSPTDNDLSASDREFSRWGGKGSIGYKIFPRLRFDTSVGASLISRQFGPSTWLTQAMLAQVTYSMRNFSGYGGLLFSKEAASLSVPTVPAINVGVGYKLR
jgi:hypothetical protein